MVLKAHHWGPTLRDSDSAKLGWGPGVCIVHGGGLSWSRKSIALGTESSCYLFLDLR